MIGQATAGWDNVEKGVKQELTFGANCRRRLINLIATGKSFLVESQYSMFVHGPTEKLRNLVSFPSVVNIL